MNSEKKLLDHSLVDYLHVGMPYLAPKILLPRMETTLRAIARMLPPLTLTIFESHLNTVAPRLDLALCILPPHDRRDALKNSLIPLNISKSSAWHRVQHICRQWAKPDSILHKSVENVWLEFDLDGQQMPDAAIPSLFVGLNPQGRRNEEAIIHAITLLLDTPASPILQRYIEQCLLMLPSPTTIVSPGIVQVGAMLARQADAIRVCLAGISQNQLIPYLEAIGWPGSTAELTKLLGIIGPYVHEVAPHLEIGETLSPKIGIECFVHYTSQMAPAQWSPILDQLVAAGYCTIDKRDAILGWIGVSTDQDCRDIWPDNLNRTSKLLGAGTRSVFVRRLNHLKFVYQPEEKMEVKAYLSLRHVWLTPRSLPKGQGLKV